MNKKLICSYCGNTFANHGFPERGCPETYFENGIYKTRFSKIFSWTQTKKKKRYELINDGQRH